VGLLSIEPAVIILMIKAVLESVFRGLMADPEVVNIREVRVVLFEGHSDWLGQGKQTFSYGRKVRRKAH